MIYVTVGTAGKGIDFTRLIQEMDRIAGLLGLDVLIQRGPSDYEPHHARHVRFVRFDEAMKHFREADFVVGHCGAGTVINGFRFAKPLILVPRRMDEGELDTDDHQLQLARQIEGVPGIRVVYRVEDLEAAVREFLSGSVPAPRPSQEKARLIAAIREFLTSPTT
jgi:UDP-N-acetylglucosamine transferase subunit ALG13